MVYTKLSADANFLLSLLLLLLYLTEVWQGKEGKRRETETRIKVDKAQRRKTVKKIEMATRK